MPPDRAQTLRSIASNVQKWRLRRALTQAELAERADLELRFVQRVEQAKINFGVVGLVQLAQALNVRPGELLRPAELARPVKGRPRGIKSGVAKSAAYGLRKIEPKTLAVAECLKARLPRTRK